MNIRQPTNGQAQEGGMASDFELLRLDARYISAWNEINARIAGRDRISLAFVTICVSLLAAGFVVSGEPIIGKFVWLLIPFVAMVVTEMFASHDLLIGLLSAHLGDVAKAAGKVPEWDWHVGSKYVGRIWRKRLPMYIAHVLSVLLFSVFALTYGWPGSVSSALGDPSQSLVVGSTGLWVVWAVSAVATVWAIVRTVWVLIERVVTAERHAH